mmetsp:Transcript_151521/g.267405  ORF Transcript_151521/g.267405 Transcript_151521/m.267405 type:complete len:119 (+) Transcript_151521:1097-1453(+)
MTRSLLVLEIFWVTQMRAIFLVTQLMPEIWPTAAPAQVTLQMMAPLPTLPKKQPAEMAGHCASRHLAAPAALEQAEVSRPLAAAGETAAGATVSWLAWPWPPVSRMPPPAPRVASPAR